MIQQKRHETRRTHTRVSEREREGTVTGRRNWTGCEDQYSREVVISDRNSAADAMSG